ncbi:hypothetical protein LZ31DRAFT_281631 [Colletotrichum somersetense]|nr:hypothetical protein LZ31DRAFT_281631 [Colletotrichum somersetense]
MIGHAMASWLTVITFFHFVHTTSERDFTRVPFTRKRFLRAAAELKFRGPSPSVSRVETLPPPHLCVSFRLLRRKGLFYFACFISLF